MLVMRSLFSARWLVAVAVATVGCGTSNSSSNPSPDGSGAQDASGSGSGGSGSGSGGISGSSSSSGGSVVDGGGSGSGSSGGSTGDGGSGDGGASGGIDGGPDGSNDSGGASGRMQAVYMTFYGWPDNSPPGGAIAYPKSGGFSTVHNVAGGTGTYADPITYATDMAELPVGTLVYAPVIKKYIVMEDDCAQCDTDWAGSKKWHIDVWMNSNAAANTSAVLACENQWTQTSTVVEVTPPPGRTVTTPPLFDTSTNSCRTSP
jgi:hypothetical protein